MLIATLQGRLQTKMLTYVLLALLTAPFWLWQGSLILNLFAIALLVGIILEIIWASLVSYQPGWLTFLFGIVELTVIVAATITMRVPTPPLAIGILYYLITWIMIQLFLLYAMPILFPRWGDRGGEWL